MSVGLVLLERLSVTGLTGVADESVEVVEVRDMESELHSDSEGLREEEA